jgi:hypothetical protein
MQRKPTGVARPQQQHQQYQQHQQQYQLSAYGGADSRSGGSDGLANSSLSQPLPQRPSLKKSAEDFEQLLQTGISTRITLSDPHLNDDNSEYSDGELSTDALSSKDAFYSYVSNGNSKLQPAPAGAPPKANGETSYDDDDFDEFDRPLPGRRKPTSSRADTQSLAEFLKNTGPEPSTSQAVDEAKPKRRNTGIFKFGSGGSSKNGKKSSGSSSTSTSSNSSSNKQKYIPLDAYTPNSSPMGSDTNLSIKNGAGNINGNENNVYSNVNNNGFGSRNQMMNGGGNGSYGGPFGNTAGGYPMDPTIRSQQQQQQQGGNVGTSNGLGLNANNNNQFPPAVTARGGSIIGPNGQPMLAAPRTQSIMVNQQQQMMGRNNGMMLPPLQFQISTPQQQMQMQQQPFFFPNQIQQPQQLQQQSHLMPAATWGQQMFGSLGTFGNYNDYGNDFDKGNDTSEDTEEDDDLFEDDDDDDVIFDDFMDEEVRDNTMKNAIVDTKIINATTGGDPDAPMPRVTHKRNVNFSSKVKEVVLYSLVDEYGREIEGSMSSGDDSYDEDAAPQMYELISDLPLKPEAPMGREPPVIGARGASLAHLANKNGGGSPTPPATASESKGPLEHNQSVQPTETVHQLQDPPQSEMTYTVSSKSTEPAASTQSTVPQNNLSSSLTPKQPSMPSADTLPTPDPRTESGTSLAMQTTPAAEASSAALSTTATSSTPGASSTEPPRPRRKVRHVQIQTRGATMKHQLIQYEAPEGSPGEAPSTATANVETTRGDDEMEGKIKQLRSQIEAIKASNQLLFDKVEGLEESKRVKEDDIVQKMQNFNRLSAQATKKIKELLADRQVLEKAIGDLRVQVQYFHLCVLPITTCRTNIVTDVRRRLPMWRTLNESG